MVGMHATWNKTLPMGVEFWWMIISIKTTTINRTHCPYSNMPPFNSTLNAYLLPALRLRLHAIPTTPPQYYTWVKQTNNYKQNAHQANRRFQILPAITISPFCPAYLPVLLHSGQEFP